MFHINQREWLRKLDTVILVAGELNMIRDADQGGHNRSQQIHQAIS